MPGLVCVHLTCVLNAEVGVCVGTDLVLGWTGPLGG